MRFRRVGWVMQEHFQHWSSSRGPLPPFSRPFPDHSLTVQEVPVFVLLSALDDEAGDEQLIKRTRAFTQLFTAQPQSYSGQQREFKIYEMSDPEVVDSSTSSMCVVPFNSARSCWMRHKLGTDTPLTSARGEKYFPAENNEWPEPNRSQMVAISGCSYHDLGEQVSQAPWP